ncbi:hypothetical protein AAFF_G00424660 [Aldrovandia affinis]|uniref:Uncharacterized protein n=1 Tax=Aldrovandia affinis TaxID=143900 RepID=A0AAD7T6V3_9TELE|nr:hypothetical protein AAFF_G00424660 [Aldrovandia affinis]
MRRFHPLCQLPQRGALVTCGVERENLSRLCLCQHKQLVACQKLSVPLRDRICGEVVDSYRRVGSGKRGAPEDREGGDRRAGGRCGAGLRTLLGCLIRADLHSQAGRPGPLLTGPPRGL